MVLSVSRDRTSLHVRNTSGLQESHRYGQSNSKAELLEGDLDAWSSHHAHSTTPSSTTTQLRTLVRSRVPRCARNLHGRMPPLASPDIYRAFRIELEKINWTQNVRFFHLLNQNSGKTNVQQSAQKTFLRAKMNFSTVLLCLCSTCTFVFFLSASSFLLSSL